MIRKLGRRATGAAVLCLLAAGALPAARAQDEDPELKKLREDADTEIEKKDQKKKDEAPKAPGDESAADLRNAADKVADAHGDDPSLIDRGVRGALSGITENLNAFNPRIVVATDLLGRLAANHYKTVEDGSPIDDRFQLREAELDLRADIDPYAKGVAIIAVAESDPGKFEVDVEEGYFTLECLPYGLKLKAGRFRVPFGRMNALHTHDLPQSTRPYMVQDLFGSDGYNDNGAILSWLVPQIPLPLELQAIVLNGENARTLSSTRMNQPAYMGRAETFFQLTDVAWLSLGGSYLFGYNDTRGTLDHPHQSFQETQLAEADLLFKWQPNQFKSVVVLLEYYDVIKRDRLQTLGFDTGAIDASGNPILSPVTRKHHDTGQGAYGTLQVQPFQRWYLGLRGDWSNFDEARPHHEQWAASAWVSFYTTEFLRFRVGYEHRERFSSGFYGSQDHSPNDTLFFEVTYVFGAHPAEPFWVNK